MKRPRAYYNEIDPFAAAWLRELIKAGHIAPGDVDERSIEDVTPNELKPYTQCHFFAGIGGWSYALRLAGWPDDRPVWTGSCPCQPFSAAGKGTGFADERHLWPAWFYLIQSRQPVAIFGEQVASRAGLQWFDLVLDDLEGVDYAVRAIALPACSVGAPHLRQRLWFVANAGGVRRHERGKGDNPEYDRAKPTPNGENVWLANASSPRLEGRQEQPTRQKLKTAERGRDAGHPWQDPDWIECRDGKARPVEPGTFPLAHGVPARVGRLRGYGNAIVPQVAAKFIEAAVETRP